jgi:hypothetical protein
MNIIKKAPPTAGLYNFFSRPTKCKLFSIVSDFISKVKHVFGYGFSGYRLGFSRINWIWSYDQELDLERERFLKGYDLLRINYVFGNLVLTSDTG